MRRPASSRTALGTNSRGMAVSMKPLVAGSTIGRASTSLPVGGRSRNGFGMRKRTSPASGPTSRSASSRWTWPAPSSRICCDFCPPMTGQRGSNRQLSSRNRRLNHSRPRSPQRIRIFPIFGGRSGDLSRQRQIFPMVASAWAKPPRRWNLGRIRFEPSIGFTITGPRDS